MTISRNIQLTSTLLNITLRPPKMDDVERIHEAVLVSIPQLRPWMEWCDENYSIEVPNAFVKAQPESWANDTNYQFTIIDREIDQVLGGGGLNHINRYYRMANLGYWIRSDRTKEGFATEATRLIAKFGFEQLGLKRIEIVTAVDNIASRRVAEKSGATFEAILRNRMKLQGVNIDAAMHSLIPEDLE
jgi:RimJ/RimL family protein N-acetyltransferase